jgi:predicted DNA-binding protein
MTEKQDGGKVLRVRLTPHEWRKLEAFAAKQGRTKSGVIHEYIRRLPNPGQGKRVIE